jgi:hypothetical protein
VDQIRSLSHLHIGHWFSPNGWRVVMGRKLRMLAYTLSIVGFAGATWCTLPASAAPIAASKGVAAIVPVLSDDVVQIRGGRGGYRGGGGYRGAGVRGGYRGGYAYRGGYGVRRGVGVAAVAGAAAYGAGYSGGGYCDPNYQACGTGYYGGTGYSGAPGYYGGGVYRGGAVVRGGAVRRGGAYVSHHRGGGARVAHRGGGRGGRR